MSRFVLYLNVASLILLSIASSSLGYKLDFKKSTDSKEISSQNVNDGVKPVMDKAVNEINYCIMGCVKCANGDMYFKDETVSATPITVTCANTCLIASDLKDLIYDLSKRKITKDYAKCLIDHALIIDY